MEISKVLNGIESIGWTGAKSGAVSSVCYNSRNCEKGSLFVAISGMKTDGHLFIGDAIRNGARFVVHEREFSFPTGITAIRVRDSRKALGQIGRNFFRDPSSSLYLVAVVGTNGKTTTTYLLESILRNAGHSVGVLGTVNYRYGMNVVPAPNTTPESFEMQRILREMVDHGTTHSIAEVSSHAIDLKRVDDCSFDMGIFTNLTQDHLDYHKTMENYYHAKRRFFSEVLPASGKKSGVMIINGDDVWGQRIIRETKGKYTTYGLDPSNAVNAGTFKLSLDGISARIVSKQAEFEISAKLMGKFNLYNLLAAISASLEMGISPDTIREGLISLPQVPGRLEKVSEPNQPFVFVDYAHTDDALRRVLENLLAFRKGRIITIFGCGGDRDRGKRPLMGEAASHYSDLTIVTSDNPRNEDPLEIIKEIERGITVPKIELNMAESAGTAAIGKDSGQFYAVISDRSEAIYAAIASAGRDDIVLIAGKGHEDYQIIGNRKLPFDDRQVAIRALKIYHGAGESA